MCQPFLPQFTLLATDFVRDPLNKGRLLDTMSSPGYAGDEVVKGVPLTPDMFRSLVRGVVALVKAVCEVWVRMNCETPVIVFASRAPSDTYKLCGVEVVRGVVPLTPGDG